MSERISIDLIGLSSYRLSRNNNALLKDPERPLLNDFDSTFEELLHRNEEVTIHVENLQKLMLEVYKCTTSGNPSFLWESFNRPFSYSGKEPGSSVIFIHFYTRGSIEWR